MHRHIYIQIDTATSQHVRAGVSVLLNYREMSMVQHTFFLANRILARYYMDSFADKGR